MKLNSRISLFGAVVALGVLSGCGPSWKVLKASNPTTLGAPTNVAVAFDYSQMMVEKKTVEQLKADKLKEDPKFEETWNELITKFESYTIEGMKGSVPSAHAASAGPGDVTVTIRPVTFGMGKYIVVSSWPTTMNVVVGSHAGEGADTDEIQFMTSYPSSSVQPSVHQHIGHIGQQIGQQVGRFFNSKAPKK